jgi:hypothetical protein
MRLKSLYCLLAITLVLFHMPGLSEGEVWAQIVAPEEFFGFKPGSDRMLFEYEELISYLQNLDNASPMLDMQEIGTSPMGKTMYIAFISSEENIRQLERLREINKRLAIDPKIPDQELEQMLQEGRVFFLATLSMHSGEVGPSQSAPLIAYELLTTQDPVILEWLHNVVYMMVPCHNPDGMDMVVNHYKKYKGTKYEGSSMPGVYHKYVGHDNNRDFVILSQEDTKAIARIYNKDWFPEVMVEKHQMGSRGPRYYVPPPHDPIAENVDGELWNWTGIFGYNMIKDMTNEGLSGVSQHYLFDDYWPGSTETCIWKNVIGFLTECASVKYATPIFIEPNELAVGGKGLAEYKKSINMPEVWPGGWWRLSDIVDYEIISTKSILKTASLHRKDILQFRNEICRREVLKGQNEAPYYYIIPAKQHDMSELVGLINLLLEQGIDVFKLNSSVTIANKLYNAGDFVVPLAQSFRAFAKEVMEKQVYPVRHYTPDGEIIKPYDITTWSLPFHRGVHAKEINIRSQVLESALERVAEPVSIKENIPDEYTSAIFTINNNESFKAAFSALKSGMQVKRLDQTTQAGDFEALKGSFVLSKSSQLEELIKELSVTPKFIRKEVELKASVLKMPRIALVETYFHDMDAGWTRFIFDSYGIPFTIVRPGEFEKTDFTKSYDIVIFPDNPESILMEGKRKARDEYYVTSYPPEFTKGIGKEGMKRILSFLDQGGIIISWGRSSNIFKGLLAITRNKDIKEEFQLPFNDISEQLQKEGLYCPGSFVRVLVTKDHPLTMGTPQEIGVFYRGRPVFSTSMPNFDMDRRVIAKFPEDNILLSGYCEKEEKIGNKSIMLWLKKGKGQMVLFGFNPQFRASTNVSFKLLFNALLLPKIVN